MHYLRASREDNLDSPVMNSVKKEQLQSIELVIKVVDHDQVGSNDPIGKVVLRKRFWKYHMILNSTIIYLNHWSKKATGQALKHWMGMINVPRRPVALWHTLEVSQNNNLPERVHILLPSYLEGFILILYFLFTKFVRNNYFFTTNKGTPGVLHLKKKHKSEC